MRDRLRVTMEMLAVTVKIARSAQHGKTTALIREWRMH